MLDIKKIRENGKQLDEALANRKHEASSSLIIDLDRKNRDLIGELQGLQEERNAKSKLIGEHASNGKKDEAHTGDLRLFFTIRSFSSPRNRRRFPLPTFIDDLTFSA